MLWLQLARNERIAGLRMRKRKREWMVRRLRVDDGVGLIVFLVSDLPTSEEDEFFREIERQFETINNFYRSN